MDSTYSKKIANNSSLLSKLFKNLDENSLIEAKNLIQDKSVKKFLENEDLVYTVELFFKNNLNIIKTSKDAIIHRNTLLYRIDKIKKLLGLDIRNFEDAVTLNVILELNRLSEKRKNRQKASQIQTLKN